MNTSELYISSNFARLYKISSLCDTLVLCCLLLNSYSDSLFKPFIFILMSSVQTLQFLKHLPLIAYLYELMENSILCHCGVFPISVTNHCAYMSLSMSQSAFTCTTFVWPQFFHLQISSTEVKNEKKGIWTLRVSQINGKYSRSKETWNSPLTCHLLIDWICRTELLEEVHWLCLPSTPFFFFTLQLLHICTWQTRLLCFLRSVLLSSTLPFLSAWQ